MAGPFITNSVGDAEGNAGIEISDPSTGVRAKVNADGQLLVDVGGLDINPGDTALAEIATDTDNLAGIKAGTDKIITAPATEAKQDTSNSFLDSIDGKLPAPVGSKIPVASTEVPSATLYDGSQATSTGAAALNGGTPQAIREGTNYQSRYSYRDAGW